MVVFPQERPDLSTRVLRVAATATLTRPYFGTPIAVSPMTASLVIKLSGEVLGALHEGRPMDSIAAALKVRDSLPKGALTCERMFLERVIRTAEEVVQLLEAGDRPEDILHAAVQSSLARGRLLLYPAERLARCSASTYPSTDGIMEWFLVSALFRAGDIEHACGNARWGVRYPSTDGWSHAKLDEFLRERCTLVRDTPSSTPSELN
jgi:hypothetical protein